MGTTIKQKLNSIDAGIKISKMLSEFNLTTKKEIENIQTIIQSENIVQEQGSSLLLIFHNLKNTIDKNNEINTEAIEKLDNLKKSVYDYSNVNLIIGELSRNREKKKEQYITSVSSVVVESDVEVSNSKTGILEKIDREILSSALGAMSSYDGLASIASLKGLGLTLGKEFFNVGMDTYYLSLYPKFENFFTNTKVGNIITVGVYYTTFTLFDIPEFLESKYYEQEIKRLGYKLPTKVGIVPLALELVSVIYNANNLNINPLIISISQRILQPEKFNREFKAMKNKFTKKDFEGKYSKEATKNILNLAESICEYMKVSNHKYQKRIIRRLAEKSREEVVEEVHKILKNYDKTRSRK